MLWSSFKYLTTGLLLILLSHCGWHLRGTSSPLPPISLEIIKQSPYDLRFIQALEQQGVKIVGNMQTQWHLKIKNIEYTKKPVMLDLLGNVSKIQLQASLLFHFYRGEKQLMENKSLQTFKEYTFDETAVLAKEKEDRLNQDSAFQDLAIRTRSILSAIKKKSESQP